MPQLGEAFIRLFTKDETQSGLSAIRGRLDQLAGLLNSGVIKDSLLNINDQFDLMSHTGAQKGIEGVIAAIASGNPVMAALNIGLGLFNALTEDTKEKEKALAAVEKDRIVHIRALNDAYIALRKAQEESERALSPDIKIDRIKAEIAAMERLTDIEKQRINAVNDKLGDVKDMNSDEAFELFRDRKKSKNNIEDINKQIEWMKSTITHVGIPGFVQELSDMTNALDPLEQAIRDVNKQFDDLKQRALDSGLSPEFLNDIDRKRFAKIQEMREKSRDDNETKVAGVFQDIDYDALTDSQKRIAEAVGVVADKYRTLMDTAREAGAQQWQIESILSTMMDKTQAAREKAIEAERRFYQAQRDVVDSLQKRMQIQAEVNKLNDMQGSVLRQLEGVANGGADRRDENARALLDELNKYERKKQTLLELNGIQKTYNDLIKAKEKELENPDLADDVRDKTKEQIEQLTRDRNDAERRLNIAREQQNRLEDNLTAAQDERTALADRLAKAEENATEQRHGMVTTLDELVKANQASGASGQNTGKQQLDAMKKSLDKMDKQIAAQQTLVQLAQQAKNNAVTVNINGN